MLSLFKMQQVWCSYRPQAHLPPYDDEYYYFSPRLEKAHQSRALALFGLFERYTGTNTLRLKLSWMLDVQQAIC